MEAAGFTLPPLSLGEGVSLVAYTNLADPAGSPEQCKGALGTPEVESRSSNPQQPSKQGNSPSNPISAIHHPGCQSRCDLWNFPDTILASRNKSTGRGAGLGSSSSALELAAPAESAPWWHGIRWENVGPVPRQVENGRVTTTMQRISYKIKPSQAQGEARSLRYQSWGDSP